MKSLSLRKYGTVMRISIASNLAYMMEVVFRSLFLIALIFVFGQLWRTTYSARGIQLLSGFSVSDMIWYLVDVGTHYTPPCSSQSQGFSHPVTFV